MKNSEKSSTLGSQDIWLRQRKQTFLGRARMVVEFTVQVLWQRFQAIAMKMIKIFCSCYKAHFVITWNNLLVRHWIISISMDSLFVHTESNINIKAYTVTVTCRTAIEASFLNSLLLIVQIDSFSCSFTSTCPFFTKCWDFVPQINWFCFSKWVCDC